MYRTKRTLSDRVNLKMRPAVMSFLLMTASTPMSSASRTYSRFSTWATVRATPNFFATTQARMFASSFPVTATTASYSRRPSSTRKSELRPSPFTSCAETISAISLPPRIITLSTSTLSLPMNFMMAGMPSRLAMMYRWSL